jgi:hypothetical protein
MLQALQAPLVIIKKNWFSGEIRDNRFSGKIRETIFRENRCLQNGIMSKIAFTFVSFSFLTFTKVKAIA